MRILMVTPYPPVRDGIAAYAVQSVRALRAQGHDVQILSPGPSAAHHHLDLVGPRGVLALAKRVRAYDKLIVQFHPDFFYPFPASPADRVQVNLALTAAFRLAHEVEVVLHEVNVALGRPLTVEGQTARRMWSSVDRISVHSERERQDFARAYGVPRGRIVVAEHGADFVPRTRHDRPSARRSLGVPQSMFVFLSIGFIQPSKGYDRAVHAFDGLDQRTCRLDVVGSVRVDDPGFLAYRDELAALVDGTDGVYLHDGYVSDELFDRWIVAADVVVLPYRSIWSSGVLERARLYGRPVIAAAIGGLPEQVGELAGATLVADDTELRLAMRSAVGADAGVEVAAEPWPAAGADGSDLRERVQREVVARAAGGRGSRLVRRESGDLVAPVAASSASAPLRRVHALAMPAPTSSRALAGLAKRAVRRLTAWEMEPVVHQLNALRAATVEAVEAATVAAAGRQEAGGTARGGSDGGPTGDPGSTGPGNL